MYTSNHSVFNFRDYSIFQTLFFFQRNAKAAMLITVLLTPQPFQPLLCQTFVMYGMLWTATSLHLPSVLKSK